MVIMKENVSSGIYASDKYSLQDEGFFDAWLENSTDQKGLLFSSWMEESANPNSCDHALVNNIGYTNNLKYKDDVQKSLASFISDDDFPKSPNADVYTIEEVMQKSPLGSPTSSNDELCYESLEELLNGLDPTGDFLNQMSPIDVSTNEDMSMTDSFMNSVPVASPMSDSGISSLGSCSPAMTTDLIAELLEEESLNFDLNRSTDDRLDGIINSQSLKKEQTMVNIDLQGTFSSPPESVQSEESVLSISNQGAICVVPLQESQKMVAPKALTKERHAPYHIGKVTGKGKRKSKEQKERKKMQNRDAAIRYRNKKKDELADMFNEAEDLESQNKELRGKADGLKKEIDYLKELMLDVIKARLSNGATTALQNVDITSLSSTLT